MVKELYADMNLYILEQLVYLLSDYSFDDEITQAICDLQKLVIKKLYANFDFEGRDIEKQEFVIRYYLEK